MDYEIILPDEVSQQPETYGQQAKRVGIGAGLGALKGLEGIASFIPNLLGVKNPHPFPSEIIKERAGLTPEYLEPQGNLESFVQRFAQYAPLAATGGVSGLGRAALGSAAGAGVKALGLPESLQDIAHLGTEIGSSIYGGKIPSLKSVQKQEYDFAKAALKPGSKVNADVINKALQSVESELGTEVGGKTAKKIQHTIKTIGENMTRGQIDPVKAMDLRKKLYQESRNLPDVVNKTYMEPLIKSINEFFTVYGAENPKFFDHLSTADKLTQFKHATSYIGDFADKLNLSKIPGVGAASDVVKYLLSNGEKYATGFIKNKPARHFMAEAITAAVQDNRQSFIKNINNMAKKMPQLQEDMEETEYEIILPK